MGHFAPLRMICPIVAVSCSAGDNDEFDGNRALPQRRLDLVGTRLRESEHLAGTHRLK